MVDRFDQDSWERRWSDVLRDHADQIAARPANPLLVDLVGSRPPGRALDAGCGHGAEAIWLAGHGWSVTAVDFSAAALAHGAATAEALGPDIADRIEWTQVDLGSWSPRAASHDLVVSLYVHIAGSVSEMVARLAAGVSPGGTLLLVGHLPIDPATGADSPAAGQVQVTVDAATEVLDPAGWELLVAEHRTRSDAATGADAVVIARRHAP